MSIAALDKPIDPICVDVLDPLFDEKNAPAGYDPAYDYVGSDWVYRNFKIGLIRHFGKTDINRAAWLHDRAYESAHTLAAWNEANATFRRNVIKLMAANGHPLLGRVIGDLHYLGVESIPALIDWMFC